MFKATNKQTVNSLEGLRFLVEFPDFYQDSLALKVSLRPFRTQNGRFSKLLKNLKQFKETINKVKILSLVSEA